MPWFIGGPHNRRHQGPANAAIRVEIETRQKHKLFFASQLVIAPPAFNVGTALNLYLDPKETHNYMTRKLAYVEAFQLGIRAHLGTFKRYPPKQVMGLKAQDRRQA